MFKTLTDAKLYKDAGYKAFVTSQWVANNACGLIQTTATAVKDYALPVAIASANSASEFYHNMPEDTRNYVRNATLVFGGVSTVAFAASRVAKTMGTSTNGPAKKKQRIENVSPTEANEGVQFKSTNLTADNNSNVSKVTSTTTTNNNNNDITTTKIATTAEQEQIAMILNSERDKIAKEAIENVQKCHERVDVILQAKNAQEKTQKMLAEIEEKNAKLEEKEAVIVKLQEENKTIQEENKTIQEENKTLKNRLLCKRKREVEDQDMKEQSSVPTQTTVAVKETTIETIPVESNHSVSVYEEDDTSLTQVIPKTPTPTSHKNSTIEGGNGDSENDESSSEDDDDDDDVPKRYVKSKMNHKNIQDLNDDDDDDESEEEDNDDDLAPDAGDASNKPDHPDHNNNDHDGKKSNHRRTYANKAKDPDDILSSSSSSEDSDSSDDDNYNDHEATQVISKKSQNDDLSSQGSSKQNAIILIDDDDE